MDSLFIWAKTYTQVHLLQSKNSVTRWWSWPLHDFCSSFLLSHIIPILHFQMVTKTIILTFSSLLKLFQNIVFTDVKSLKTWSLRANRNNSFTLFSQFFVYDVLYSRHYYLRPVLFLWVLCCITWMLLTLKSYRNRW